MVSRQVLSEKEYKVLDKVGKVAGYNIVGGVNGVYKVEDGSRRYSLPLGVAKIRNEEPKVVLSDDEENTLIHLFARMKTC